VSSLSLFATLHILEPTVSSYLKTSAIP